MNEVVRDGSVGEAGSAGGAPTPGAEGGDVLDLERSVALLREIVRVDATVVGATATLADLEVDSLDVLEWIFALEEEFDVVIGEEALADAGLGPDTTVGAIVAYLSSQLAREMA